MYAFRRLSGNQAKLGMHLVGWQTVNHLTTGIFQATGHFNVARFIKTRSELYQSKDFFSIFRSITKRLHNLAVTRHAVKGNLNGAHRIICSRSL